MIIAKIRAKIPKYTNCDEYLEASQLAIDLPWIGQQPGTSGAGLGAIVLHEQLS